MRKTIRIKEKKSKVKEVHKNLKTDKITDITVELSWDAVNDKKHKAISYQVSLMNVSGSSLFRRNAALIEKTGKDEKLNETKYNVKKLEQDTE